MLPTRSLLVVASGTVLAGFIGGLVVSGRMSLTSPSGAESTQAPVIETSRPATAAAAALPDLSSVAEAALAASVNISSTTTVRLPQDPFYQFFYGNRDRVQQSQSLGSGVVVSPDGYILTNKHVIGNAGADIRVTLTDGRERPGRLIGLDDVSDLAVVKIEADKLQTLPWGDSSKLRVAEWVLAIGNPFQLSGTVTLGIVSTVNRSGDQVGAYQEFIQTDAAINPGNSGGALVNARGELVGINTMIYSETGGYQGIGFAIPSAIARSIMTELIRNRTVTWGSIGAIEWLNITPAVAERYGLDITGPTVRAISRSASAYQAGLEPGDTVVAIEGQPITSPDQIDRLIVRQKVGSSLKFDVVKGNGRRVQIVVPVVARQAAAGPRAR